MILGLYGLCMSLMWGGVLIGSHTVAMIGVGVAIAVTLMCWAEMAR